MYISCSFHLFQNWRFNATDIQVLPILYIHKMNSLMAQEQHDAPLHAQPCQGKSKEEWLLRHSCAAKQLYMERLPRASPRAACRSSKNPGGAVQDARAITTKNKKHTPTIIMKKKCSFIEKQNRILFLLQLQLYPVKRLCMKERIQCDFQLS